MEAGRARLKADRANMKGNRALPSASNRPIHNRSQELATRRDHIEHFQARGIEPRSRQLADQA
jgi:hypothetical protein